MADNERLNSILCKFDADWMASDEARTEATNDLYFSRVSQWDDWLSDYTTLQYRGQFDVVRPVVRKLVAEMRRNPIDVLFRPKDGADPNSADVLMGMYRTDMRHNTAKISVNIAVREQIEAGVGAWRLITEYEDQDPTSNNQVIRRVPIHEACTHVVWDSNSKQMDKSDAMHCTVINAMSRDGWKAFAEKNGFDEEEIPSFQNPDMNWLFPWLTSDVVYVGEYYEVEEKKETVFIYQDPLTGEPVSYFQRDIKDVIDELADKGMIKVAEKKVKRRRVYKSIITCTTILKDREPIAGEHIPIVPVYGEWSFAGDKEVYEGVVRLTKDGQRLRNMIMSFNADIVARTPKKKPIFWPEQIEGYEYMYGGNDDYPYYLLNRTDENNGDLPLQPISYMENPEVPQANAYMLEAATNSVSQVATMGVDAEAANGQVAFDTVNQLNMRADLETYVFQDNLATAMRRDGEIYQSMVNDIYDVPRQVMMTLEDGTEKQVQLLTQAVDYQTGTVVTLNDIRGRYECYTDTGPSFQSMKEQNRAEIQELLAKVPPGTPEWQMLLLQYFTLLDGKGVEMMREYANKQLVMMGLKKPETPEEMQMVEQAQQQPKEPSPEQTQAQGVLLQGQAELLKAQNQQMQIQVDAAKAEGQNQLNAAKVAEIFNNMDLDKQSAFREFLKLMQSYQQQNSDDARANAELLLKGDSQQHSQRMDFANILQSQRQNQPSGRAAEIPQ
ncbi:portal protein [Enterobacter hormaechei]|uniref:portal protein n=1 Tax=Enterobacter hormaechei TaxID=158836 RepID=UPI000E309DBF|nr:portal protein [Enterobacter hormaechei]RFF35204.1 portal protein [Enterobacter hormaechei]RFF35263.1 portal protein [Enterobacter hormaechei]